MPDCCGCMKIFGIKVSSGEPLLMGFLFPQLFFSNELPLKNSLSTFFCSIRIKCGGLFLDVFNLFEKRFNLCMNVAKVVNIPLFKCNLGALYFLA
jgi:hypothetical protein